MLFPFQNQEDERKRQFKHVSAVTLACSVPIIFTWLLASSLNCFLHRPHFILYGYQTPLAGLPLS